MYFFFPKKIKPWSIEKISDEIQKKDCQFIGIKIDKPDTIPENLYPQARKAARSIGDVSKKADFTIFDVKFYIDEKEKKIYFIIKTKKEKLPKTLTHMGPPKKLKSHSDKFIEKWQDDSRVDKKPYEKDGRYYVELIREYLKGYEKIMR